MFGRLQDQWRKLSSFLFSILPLFLVIFVEADSLPVPQQILDSVTFCRYRWGLMIKAVSSHGSSLAVRMWTKASLISSRALASPQLQLGQLPLRDIPTRLRATLNLHMLLYTAGQFLQCGYGKRDARTPMINCEDLAKLHRDSSPAFWLQGPLGPLTLDLFGDVGLRIRRVSYLYTILRKYAEIAYVASAIHPPTLMEVQTPILRHSYTVESSCRVYNVVISPQPPPTWSALCGRVLAYCHIHDASQPQSQALVRRYSVHQECMTSSLPPADQVHKPLRAQEVVELHLQKNAPPQVSIAKVTLLTHSIEPRSRFQLVCPEMTLS